MTAVEVLGDRVPLCDGHHPIGGCVRCYLLPRIEQAFGERDRYKAALGSVMELDLPNAAWRILAEALTPVLPECIHEWVDARNKIVQSGELCLKCHAIRSGNRTSDDRGGVKQ